MLLPALLAGILLRVVLLRRCWGHLYALPESFCEFATTTLLGALLLAWAFL